MKSYKIAAALIGSFVLGAGAVSMLHVQGKAPYYEVAEINVKDQTGYESSGVDKVRESQKAHGGITVAGGYNKAEEAWQPSGQSLSDHQIPQQRSRRQALGGRIEMTTAKVTSTLTSVPSESKALNKNS